MKKQMVISFVCGMVVPVLLLAAAPWFSGPPAATDPDPAAVQSGAPERTIVVKNAAGNLQQMGLEEYLVGVVAAEMPASFPEEALKAQAVVARTYTRRRMNADKHDGASVCMDPGCCQGYEDPADYLERGGSQRDLDRIRQAVADTAGLVLTYEGALIDATYFSCSGGMTEDAVAVWGQDVPYLQSVRSPGEEEAPRFTDTAVFSPEEFCRRTGCAGEGEPESWFGPVTYTDGGGVDTLELCGESYSGVRLRSLLGLRSTAFSVSVEDGKIVITTRGFGHRVGMSQYGARAMAENGSGFEEILSHYYTGTALERMD